MEGLPIYPTTKLCYKRQDHVLGIEIGREDFGVKLVFQDFQQDLHFFLHLSASLSMYNESVNFIYMANEFMKYCGTNNIA